MSEVVVGQQEAMATTSIDAEHLRLRAVQAGGIFCLAGFEACGFAANLPAVAELAGGLAIASALVATVAHVSVLRQQGTRE